MFVTLCHVCRAPTTASCSLCGLPTCEDHMERFSRVCVVCLSPKRGGGA